MPRLPGLQLLRALAAMMVLTGHALAEAEHYFALTLPFTALPWTRGVDIFFVVSGFIITLSAQRFVGHPGAFLWRRFLRVAPLYYLFTTLMVVALILLPSGPKDTVLDPAQILSSYGFFPYARADGRIAPVLSLGWTLNYEMFFYLIFCLALALPRPALAASAVLLALAGFGLWHRFDSAQLTFWTNPIMIEFLYGIALARLWQSGWHRPDARRAVQAVALGLILLVALDGTDLPRFLAGGLPAALIVAGGSLLCPQHPYTGQGLGDAAFALYLSHRFSLRAATLLLLPVLPATPLAAGVYVAAVIALSVAVALLTHRRIEKPLQRALTRPRAAQVPA